MIKDRSAILQFFLNYFVQQSKYESISNKNVTIQIYFCYSCCIFYYVKCFEIIKEFIKQINRTASFK